MNQTDFASKLQTLLRLTHSPIAITFFSSPPQNVPRVETSEPASCAYWRMAAEDKVFYTKASDHYNCPIGAHTHGVELPEQNQKELEGIVQTMIGLQYIKQEEIAQLPRRRDRFRFAIYAPLDKAGEEVDIALVRGTVKQLMILVEAVQAAGVGHTTSVMGRPTCAVLPEALQSRKITTSLGCIGNRVYTGLGDDEAYMAIPGTKLSHVTEKLAALVQANQQLEAFHRSRLADPV